MASLTCHGDGGTKQVRLERIVRAQLTLLYQVTEFVHQPPSPFSIEL